VITVGGVRVTAYLRTFVDLAEVLSLVDLVAVGDHLVRRGRTTPEQLRAYCSQSCARAATLARRAAQHVREGVDSPMETRLRMLLVLAGLPEPQVNLTIRDVLGEPVRRYDLSWPEGKAIVEYDGRQHIEREEQWERDLERRAAIDEDEWRILVVTARGIYNTPARTLDQVHRMLLKRGVPGTPRRLSDAWRPHFPGRT
jgi:very-short-patch-repair endonuclease